MRCCICKREVDRWYEDEKGNIYCSEKCFEATYPKCVICGKPMKQWIEANGKKYCSERCYQETFPKCAICGKPMRQWIESEGKKYCSDTCYSRILPRCSICGKPMKQWTESNGKKYCSDACFKKILPKCRICGKPMEKWIESEGQKYCSEFCLKQSFPKCSVCGKPMKQWVATKDGRKYCNEQCFEKTLPKCSICGKPVNGGVVDEKTGKLYCNDQCFEKILPKCHICGRRMKRWTETKDGRKFCSDRCFEAILPKCVCCGRSMRNWIEYVNEGKFCDERCHQNYQNQRKVQIDTNEVLSAKELAYITGLTEHECARIMTENNLDGDSALEMIDIYMQSLYEGIPAPATIVSGLQKAGVNVKLAQRLGNYNTMRGGVKGYKGFVFEELHAADAAAKGSNIAVLGNNGLADFVQTDSVGNKIFLQAKAGYKRGQVDWSRYKDMTIVVDKGNQVLAEEARRAGLKVIESDIPLSRAELVARTQQFESKILGTKNAPITANIASAHSAGVQNMKFAAKIGVGFNIGGSIYDVLDGNKSFEEATADVIVETAKMAGAAYVGSGVITLAGSAAATLAETSIGSAVTTAVATAGAAIADTAVGSAIAGGIEAVVGAIAAIEAAPFACVAGGAAVLGFLWKAITD